MIESDIYLANQVLKAPYSVYNGVNIIGGGPLCTSGRGTNVVFKGKDVNGFIFGTNGDPYQQTGGGLYDCHVIKEGESGGSGVSLLAPSWEMRCGETCLDGLQIFGRNGGVWDKGIFIDGSLITQKGAQGVRRTIIGGMRGVRVHGAGYALHTKNAVHLCVSNFQSDPGPTKGGAKVLIEGGQNPLFNNLIINGEFEMNGVVNLSISSSFIDTIIISGNCRGVSISCTCNYLVVETGATGVFCGTINKTKTIKETNKFKVWSNL